MLTTKDYKKVFKGVYVNNNLTILMKICKTLCRSQSNPKSCGPLHGWTAFAYFINKIQTRRYSIKKKRGNTPSKNSRTLTRTVKLVPNGNRNLNLLPELKWRENIKDNFNLCFFITSANLVPSKASLTSDTNI